ncbi:transposase [Streptomyces sp. NPDC000618]|uniref:transposase n=1 Tax=Streptomyces sp. NPDC000618 TaxID=3154265 RepID=UPI00331CD546
MDPAVFPYEHRPEPFTLWSDARNPVARLGRGRQSGERGRLRPSRKQPRPRQVLPQVRMACLIEVGTHLVLDAELAGCRTGEVTLVNRLPRSCGPGQLILADREFLGVPLWRAFTGCGADLLWRVPANRVLPVDRMLRDGPWLSRIHPADDRTHTDPVMVRVVAYQLHGTGRAAEDYRLVTSLSDARRHPARRLAALYQERWEAEAVFADSRAQDPSTRSPHRAELQDPRRCRAADLGPSARSPRPA